MSTERNMGIMSDPVSATLRIELVEDKNGTFISVKALKASRFTHYGFGTFLENVKPKEVEITQEAMDALLDGRERNGVQGLEFWRDNRLAWGAPGPSLLVPEDAISVQKGAKNWIRNFHLVDAQ